MGLYEVSKFLLGFGMWTMIANFHMCVIMLVLRTVFNMLVRNASPRGHMRFRCLMFHLSGPCGLLFLLCYIASWTGKVVSVMLYPCIVCVDLLMYLFVLCVDSVCDLFGETIRNMFAILLLNVMEVCSVGGGALLDRPCMVFQRMCVLCL